MAPKFNSNKKSSLILNSLSKTAASQDLVSKARITSAIVLKNKLIAVGSNRIRTDPFQHKYSKNPFAIHLHAEINCIKTALKVITVEELAKCTLYVCRVKYTSTNKSNMEFGLAKPCEGCLRAIVEFSIPRIVYTTGPDSYVCVETA